MMSDPEKKIAVYPGSFDPITYGHIDIIKRACSMFDEVIVAVAMNLNKEPLFTEKQRVGMIHESVKGMDHVTVDSFDGLLVDYAVARGAIAVIRGLRAVSDFDFELQMALVNRKLNEQIITVFLMPHERYTYLNSSIVKEISKFGGDVNCFVPDHVKEELVKKLRTRT
jgi:pantetheine-phosphate adenylyltransferase